MGTAQDEQTTLQEQWGGDLLDSLDAHELSDADCEAVDALFDGIKRADQDAQTLNELAAFLWQDPEQFPGGADTCEYLDGRLRASGRTAARAVSVTWDTDGEDVELPETVTVPGNVADEDVADWLSDEHGWCVLGWAPTKEVQP